MTDKQIEEMNKKDIFIWEKKNCLSLEFCNNCIKKFEDDKGGKFPGEVYRGVDLNIKRSTDLKLISSENTKNWEYEDTVFFNSLNSSLTEYLKHLSNELTYDFNFMNSTTFDTGYQIQRTFPGDFYIWHHDFLINTDDYRILTYIWYLNDIHDGGHTEFFNGVKIKPEVGKLIIFPSTWNYLHRGCPPKRETKYICTGWVCNKISGEYGMSKKIMEKQ
jgi:Rps23 Pro-64 3,4-dihydroxylase Tpa1-like proline 4-hydroxylase